MTNRHVLIGFLLLAVFIAGASLLATRMMPQGEGVEDPRIRIATGPEQGVYNRFGKLVAERLGPEALLETSKGSVENLALLREGSVDFAFVQNDLAQYSKLGIRGQPKFEEIAYVLPVFAEYVQVIVPRKSRISVLSELRGTSVCIGPQGSGTYFNSLDVLSNAGLREGIDFAPINEASTDCIRDIRRGTNIAAIFLTSNQRIGEENDDLRQLYFTESMGRSLAQDFRYFRVVEPTSENGLQRTQLAVDAYLATRSGVATERVKHVAETILDNWDRFRSSLPGLGPMAIPEVRETIPYHEGAEAALEGKGLRAPNYLFWGLLVPWLALLTLCIAVEGWKVSYNRLGENPFARDWRRNAIRILGYFSRPVISLTFLLGVIWLAVLGLRYMEDYYALQHGAISPFAQMDLSDNFVWLFTYISSGFTAGDVYPASYLGKVIVAALAILGLIAPLTLGVHLVNTANRNAVKVLQGLGRVDLRGHVLLCGWNEKAAGIIYTLSGKSVAKPRHVVLVAELSDQYPLETHNFDYRHVRYIKGNPSDIAVLDRANVAGADAVIILANFAGNNTHNKQGILTAMNVRNRNENAHLCAELEYLDNLDLYQAAGCNALIYTSLVVTRLAVVAALSTNLVDYVFDAVTHGGEADDVIFSASAAEVMAALGSENMTAAELKADRVGAGVNLIGVSEQTQRLSLYDAQFAASEKGNTAIDSASQALPVDGNSILIYSSRRASKIFAKSTGAAIEPVDSPQFGLQYPDRLSLVVCSDAESLEIIERELKHVIPNLEFTAIEIGSEHPRLASFIASKLPERVDKVMVLTTHERRANLNSLDDLQEIDSDLILLTRLFSNLRKEIAAKTGTEPDWPIISSRAC